MKIWVWDSEKKRKTSASLLEGALSTWLQGSNKLCDNHSQVQMLELEGNRNALEKFPDEDPKSLQKFSLLIVPIKFLKFYHRSF